MQTFISNIGYVLPQHEVTRSDFQEFYEKRIPEGLHSLFNRISSNSRVFKRYSVIDVLNGQGNKIYPERGIHIDTKERNELYREYAFPLGLEAARKVIDNGDQSITHIITVSCTGAVTPGLEQFISKKMNLRPDIKRLGLNLMGCYAGVTALRTAFEICQANSINKVLVVCCEIASLNMQNEDIESLVAASLFGDGAGALLVESGEESTGFGLTLLDSLTYFIPNSEGEMTWQVGTKGFELHLSKLISNLISRDISQIAKKLLRNLMPIELSDIKWIIHPGGPAILDKIEENLGLKTEALHETRCALATGGNCSSATVITILSDTCMCNEWSGPLGIMAFGPGLTAECVLLNRH